MRTPFDGNVRVKVKVEPGGEMRRSESPPERRGAKLRQEKANLMKQEKQGPAKEEPGLTGMDGGSPRWWPDGFRPTEVKEETQEGLEEEPLATADGDQEFHWFGEAVAPPSMCDHVPRNEDSEKREAQ